MIATGVRLLPAGLTLHTTQRLANDDYRSCIPNNSTTLLIQSMAFAFSCDTDENVTQTFSSESKETVKVVNVLGFFHVVV